MTVVPTPAVVGAVGAGSPGRDGAARPRSIRAMNEQLLLDLIRHSEGVSRAELARSTGLSKPTVSLALANLERAGLVLATGVRTGVPGPAAVLYRVRPEAGMVLGLDVGQQFLRGAITDLAGNRRAAATTPTGRLAGRGVVAELVALAGELLEAADLRACDLTQTVIGSPGVYDPLRDVLDLAGGVRGWAAPEVLTDLRAAFGSSVMVENDIDVAALAEQAHGHGRGVDSFAFVSVGTGIGMGLVLGGRLHRGAHGAAGEIGFLPFTDGDGSDARDARRRGALEAAASAAGVVRAGRRAGLRPASAREVFAAAAAGDVAAGRVVAQEALLVAKAISAVVAVADPELVVIGGGIGQSEGFLDVVARELRRMAPVLPDLRVSALGAGAVVDGCLAAGLERAWQIVAEKLPPQA